MATTAKITEPGRAQQILDEINKLDGGKTLTQAQKDAIGTGGGGADGADGVDGASAYEIAVANGFVGTEAEWLASLEGPQGETGATGPQGPAGPAGADGADAPQNAIVSDTTQAGGGTAISNVVEITQAAYDALGTPDATTLYIIEG